MEKDYEMIGTVMVPPDESFTVSMDAMVKVAEYLIDNPPAATAPRSMVEGVIFALLTTADEYTDEEAMKLASNEYYVEVVKSIYRIFMEFQARNA